MGNPHSGAGPVSEGWRLAAVRDELGVRRHARDGRAVSRATRGLACSSDSGSVSAIGSQRSGSTCCPSITAIQLASENNWPSKRATLPRERNSSMRCARLSGIAGAGSHARRARPLGSPRNAGR